MGGNDKCAWSYTTAKVSDPAQPLPLSLDFPINYRRELISPVSSCHSTFLVRFPVTMSDKDSIVSYAFCEHLQGPML